MGEDIYEITFTQCTECVGHYDEPQCIEVCPVDCILVDPDHTETETVLLQKYENLMAEKDD